MMEHILRYPDAPASPPRALRAQPTIHPTSRLYDCMIGAWTDIGPNCVLGETALGDYSYLAGDAQVIYSEIGKFCSIASHVRINPGNHPMDRVTQHHMTYRRTEYGFDVEDDQAFFAWRREHKCVIGHDVWIGHAAIIMPGVSIATGAVVGSGAVVTRDVGPYAIVAGVPARPIRRRFAESKIAALLQIAWWDWDRATLAARFSELNDVGGFLERYG